MSVKIGEARFDENGHTSYGEPGDQTGEEVKISDFYINEQKPWTKVFRAKSEEKRQRIALAMSQACVNENIGYAQYGDGSTVYRDRYGLYYALKKDYTMDKVSTPCNCDCSSLVAQCVRAAGINVSIYMSTSDEAQILMNTGEFDELNFQKGMTLLTGDIMWRKGHTGIITNGDDGKVWNKTPLWVAYALRYCNVYNSNSTNSGLLKQWPHLGEGNLVDVCDYDNNFDYVRIAAKYFGFVEKSNMNQPDPQPGPEPPAEFTAMATTELNLRQGPGTQYDYCNIDRNDGRGVRHTLYAGETVPVVGGDNGWYNVRIEGAQYIWYPWCSAKYMVKVEEKKPQVGDKVRITGNVIYTSAENLEATIAGIDGNLFLLDVSDGCKGYLNKKDCQLL